MPGKAGERHQTMTKTERHKHREREGEWERETGNKKQLQLGDRRDFWLLRRDRDGTPTARATSDSFALNCSCPPAVTPPASFPSSVPPPPSCFLPRVAFELGTELLSS